MKKKTENIIFYIAMALIVIISLISVFATPSITTAVLNATTPQNTTSDNLTAIITADAETSTINYNWLRNGTSMAGLNIPFTFNNTDNKTIDFSGYSRNGEIRNAIFNETAGMIGGAYEFTSPGDYVLFPQAMSGNKVTYGGWVKFTTFSCPGTFCVPFQQANAADGGFEIFTNSGGSIACWDGTTNTLGVRLSLNKWYHVMCRHNGTDMVLFVNGTQQRVPVASSTNVVNINFTVGGGVQQGSYWFTGQIDEVRVYNESMSNTQIYKEFQLGYNKTISQETNTGEYWNVTGTPINSSGINGSAITSSGMTIRPDNNYVCNNPSVCEYQDITTALNGENTTDNEIRLYENNTEYQMPFMEGYDNLDINISADNVTLDCNGTTLNDRQITNDIIIDTAALMYNVTVKNCVLNSMRTGISFNNVTLGEISNVNLTTIQFIGIAVSSNSSNITLFDLNFENDTSSGTRAILLNSKAANNNLSKINMKGTLNFDISESSNNLIRYANITNDGYITLQVSAENNTISDINITNTTQPLSVTSNNNTLIRINMTNSSSGVDLSGTDNVLIDSFFEQMTDESIDASSGVGGLIRNNTFINNRDVGVVVGDDSTTINNTFRNNSIGVSLTNEANVTIINNSFFNQWDNNFASAGLEGSIFALAGALNTTISNNYFNESIVTPIFIVGALGTSRDVNITNNTFNNVPSNNASIRLYDPVVVNTNIWGNLFLSGNRGVENAGTNTLYCVNSEGNFYEESLTPETNDCGQINITNFTFTELRQNDLRQFNWTRQSSNPAFPITYNIFANSTLDGTKTNLGTSTNNKTLDLALLNYGLEYSIIVIPFIQSPRINGTNAESFTKFTLLAPSGTSGGGGGGGGSILNLSIGKTIDSIKDITDLSGKINATKAQEYLQNNKFFILQMILLTLIVFFVVKAYEGGK